MVKSLQVNFGRLEAMLAQIHGIADSKRTAFQARLKNFHRLGFPVGFATRKGKASMYSHGDIVLMALAVEITELGLPPDRVVRMLTSDIFPVYMATQMAAWGLNMQPRGFDDEKVMDDDPGSMFLFFDPSALVSLTVDLPLEKVPDLDEASATFFYGGIRVVQDNLVKWTTGRKPRLALLNVTTMLNELAWAALPEPSEDTDESDWLSDRAEFFKAIHDWAWSYYEGNIERQVMETVEKYLTEISPLDPGRDDIDAIVAEVASHSSFAVEDLRPAVVEFYEHSRNAVKA